jgi:hypothetical protein
LATPPVIRKNKVYQRFNLKKDLGVDLSDHADLAQLVGEEMLKRIRERADSGMGVDFEKSKGGTEVDLKSPYSDEYAKSPEFRAFGKSKRQVNMKLTGDMLGLMDILEVDGNNLVIGWEGDEAPKAFNHLTGDTVPRRPFFGISKDDLKSIRADLSSELRDLIRLEQESGREEYSDEVSKKIDAIKASSNDILEEDN